ncbi:MAG: preprotein translocase subunit YajC, partial [Clostridia bacterium]|nr:preprotein translocase subunit YajC [Clostridia bacterium]
MITLLEQTTEPAGFNWISLAMIAGMLALLYFFMIRPQKKQEKEVASMRNSLMVGDEITT